MSFDLVIRGGTVVDGSGLGGYRADVGIVGDRIALVGRIKEQGTREIQNALKTPSSWNVFKSA